MTVEDNKALVRRALTDLVNTGNMALVDELVAPGFVRHDLGGGPLLGPKHLRLVIGRKSVSQPASPGVPAGRREGAGGNRDAALAACLVAGAGVHQELQLSQCVVGPGGQDFPQYRAAQLRSLSLPCDALQVSLVAIDGIPERKSHGFAPSR